jgi:ornithine cyclodeaminase/alanine dehydrogenase-like protein (mu-crystallin family)
VLSYEQLIPAMERALIAFSSGEVIQPVRTMLTIEEAQRFLAVMPAVMQDAMGAKLVCFYPKNAAAGLPTHTASIALFDPETGRPLAFLDGRLITEMRTAAVSAVASQLLARPEASVLGILGSGVQARSHLEALRLVRAFRDIRVWSPRNARAFAKQFGIRAAPSAEEAVRGADVVVVATTSQTPVLSGAWLSPGTHINAVGAPRPTWRELDDDVLRKARIYVESREAATRESGDVIAAGQVVAEIGEVVTGAKRGRESADEITLFKSVGVAIEDVASADLVYRKAVQAAAAR